MAARPYWAVVAAALVLTVTAPACGRGPFGDVAQPTTTVARSQPSVTLGGSPTSDPAAAATSTSGPGSTQPATTVATATTRSGQAVAAPPSAPVVTGARTDATAAKLVATPRCDGGRPVVRLTWEPVGSAEQVVAVSSRPDGLDGGNYTSSEVLSASRNTYDLPETQPGAFYYWRVLTRRASGFAASETSQFQSPVCTSG